MYESSAIDFKNNSSLIGGGVDTNKADLRYTVIKCGIRTPQSFYENLVRSSNLTDHSNDRN